MAGMPSLAMPIFGNGSHLKGMCFRIKAHISILWYLCLMWFHILGRQTACILTWAHPNSPTHLAGHVPFQSPSLPMRNACMFELSFSFLQIKKEKLGDAGAGLVSAKIRETQNFAWWTLMPQITTLTWPVITACPVTKKYLKADLHPLWK